MSDRKDPWNELPRREANIMRDLANTMPCYGQMRDGWYSASCYEAKRKRKCVNCAILKRAHKRLAEAVSS